MCHLWDRNQVRVYDKKTTGRAKAAVLCHAVIYLAAAHFYRYEFCSVVTMNCIARLNVCFVGKNYNPISMRKKPTAQVRRYIQAFTIGLNDSSLCWLSYRVALCMRLFVGHGRATQGSRWWQCFVGDLPPLWCREEAPLRLSPPPCSAVNLNQNTACKETTGDIWLCHWWKCQAVSICDLQAARRLCWINRSLWLWPRDHVVARVGFGLDSYSSSADVSKHSNRED